MNPRLEIAVTNRILNPVLSHGWKDYDNFSAKLARYIIKHNPTSKKELVDTIKAFENHFFNLNTIDADTLIRVLPLDDIIDLLSEHREVGPLTFSDIFPETTSVTIAEGKKAIANLATLPEDKIQEALVDSLREKSATNCRNRGKDTVLEVADLEHFSVSVKGKSTTFSCVVKGSKSLGGSITLEKIAHQVMKAYNRTHPQHVLVVLARNLADSVTSDLIEYGKSVGNENLVVLCDPVDLSRFLKARKIA
ncbi:MAG: hypothetical protein NWE95_01695 [Candidatus Bathyarchaeota archaeon]|nr:hypothetical protein [Candidatus Bathyarchaeota archaeon]